MLQHRILVPLILLATLTAACTPSNDRKQSTDYPDNSDSTEREETPETALSVNYDRFENHTHVHTPSIPGREFFVSAEYRCEGEPGCQPESVSLTFTKAEDQTNSGKDQDEEDPYAFLDEPGFHRGTPGQLIFLINGERRIDVGELAMSQADEGSGEQKNLGEMVNVSDWWKSLPRWHLLMHPDNAGATARVPLKVVHAIVEANRVEYRLQQTEAVPTEQQKKVLGRMLNVDGQSRSEQ